MKHLQFCSKLVHLGKEIHSFSLAPVSQDSYRQFSSQPKVSEIRTLTTTPGMEKVTASLQGAQVAWGGVHKGGQRVAGLLMLAF